MKPQAKVAGKNARISLQKTCLDERFCCVGGLACAVCSQAGKLYRYARILGAVGPWARNAAAAVDGFFGIVRKWKRVRHSLSAPSRKLRIFVERRDRLAGRAA